MTTMVVQNTSEWTLDYPPFFSHFEYGLSKLAPYFDSKMLELNNTNYASNKTILFQRSTVIVSELTLAIAIYCLLSSLQIGRKNHDIAQPIIQLCSSLLKFVSNITVLAFATIIPFVLSFGPFIMMNQLPQVLSRLFPFKRGLSHAYWAPNIWAIYNVLDKCLSFIGRRFDLFHVRPSTISTTSGLVQDIEHVVLPSITPMITFGLTLACMMPSLIRLCRHCSKRTFIETIVLCALTSFLFGWHVHEKAILIVIIPLTLLAFDSREHARYFVLLSIFGGYSLFPLIFTAPEVPIKISLFVTYTCLLLYTLGEIHGDSGGFLRLPLLNYLETFFVILLIPHCLYVEFIHTFLHLHLLLPFLPLLLTSLYCSIPIFYCWIRLHFIESIDDDGVSSLQQTNKFYYLLILNLEPYSHPYLRRASEMVRKTLCGVIESSADYELAAEDIAVVTLCDITLYEVQRVDFPHIPQRYIICKTKIDDCEYFPIPFTLYYNAEEIDHNLCYGIRVDILNGENQIKFSSEKFIPVLTDKHPLTNVRIMVTPTSNHNIPKSYHQT
ncbi:unnamed protein product [Didymodactylos carnosus]|uniref:Alpha-1,3-glucosyltransferase n=1 Tax=Didymodactylos carnosus TaxID=1234261 RepID=A0A813U9Q8_9BILA|nr:unnamed protein product [Didymodactylos carnosus]CAF0823236.1 unnamed protein product [Didymodactylos carnosus]CAF3554352.1 unnamed protein product [Didymodactylos carnosus]CAF3609824.1 unnamed protein product [Didymodactylos carnosus]